MTNKQIGVLVVYMLMFWGCGFAFGHHIGTDQQYKINNQLRIEYDSLKTNYDNLETEYNWRLEACYTQLGDLQDKIEGGLYE